jgi:SAM-dependent methyltransferase
MLEKYRANYGLGDEIGAENVRAHLQLEAELTDRLLNSAQEERFDIFVDAYTRLYAELPWLNKISEPSTEHDLLAWKALIGSQKRVYEIGSGRGRLIKYLALQGNECVATEITRERGARFVNNPIANMTWHQTDGVHLSEFENEGFYDYVISDQVFEHLHPDDHRTHFLEARKILKSGGAYILRAPHGSAGPHDLSRVVGSTIPVFMHLFEPRYVDLSRLMKLANFAQQYAVIQIPYLTRKFGLTGTSRYFLRYQLAIESMEQWLLPGERRRSAFRKFARLLLAPSQVWIVGRK